MFFLYHLPVDSRISSKGTPSQLALLLAADLVLPAANSIVSMPAVFSSDLTHREMVSREAGL